MKPTWGRISRHGAFGFADTFDVLGPLARSAADAAAMLGAVAGHDPADPTSVSDPVPDYLAALAGIDGARGMRIAIDPKVLAAASGDMADAMSAVLDSLARIGAIVVDIEYPESDDIVEQLLLLAAIEQSYNHADLYPAHADRYGTWIRANIDIGNAATPQQIASAIVARAHFSGRMLHALGPVDAVLLPVIPTGTPSWAEVEAFAPADILALLKYTMPVNGAGLPAISLPCGFTPGGRPLGVQLVGSPHSDATLLRIGHAYQQATTWHLHHPPLNAG